MLARAKVDDHRDEVQRYLRQTYCEPFARGGWVYGDGTLAIGAYTYLLHGGTCGMGEPGRPATTVPCALVQGNDPLDCALLHLVRRAEVQHYLDSLPGGRRGVTCDDGTPLDQLGA